MDIPLNIREYVVDWHDPIGDGHCGFRAVAQEVYQDEHQWPTVRRKMLQELQVHKELYLQLAPVMFGETLGNVESRIENFSDTVESDFYLDVWRMGDIMANTFERPVFYYATHYSMSFFPTAAPVTTNPPICLAQVGAKKNYHFII